MNSFNSTNSILHSNSNQYFDQLQLITFSFRIFVSSILILTILITFASKLFTKFVFKLQSVGYQSNKINNHPINSNQNPSIINHQAFNNNINVSNQNEIIPIIIPFRKPHRSWIYLTQALIISSYIIDGTVIIIRAVWQHRWEPSDLPAWKGLDAYLLISLVAYISLTVAMSSEERLSRQATGWGKAYTKAFCFESCLGELIIAILTIRLVTFESQPTEFISIFKTSNLESFDIIHLVNLFLRLLLIILLCMLHLKWLYHREFVAANPPQLPNEASSNQSAGYGTFVAPSTGSNSHVLSTKAQLREAPKPTGVLKMLKRVKILFPYLWPRQSRALQLVALCCFFFLCVGRAVNLLVPMTLGEATEDLSQARSPWFHLAVYVGLRFLQGSGGIVSVIQSNLWIPLAQYADRSMSMMSFTHLLDLSLSYHTRRKTAEVLRILDRGSAINQFFQLLIFSLVPIFLDIGLAVGYLAFRFDIFLAGMLLLMMIGYATASVVLTQWRTAMRREMVDKDKYTRGIQGDSLLNWETIAWFNTKTFETDRYLEATIDYQRSEFDVMSSLYILNLVQNAIITVALLIGCFTVAFQVSVGRKTVGDFVLFVSYVAQLVGPLNQLGTLYRVIQQNLTDTDNLMKLLAEPKEIEDRPNAQTIVKAKGEIEFDHVRFSYDGRSSALEDISFVVPAGSSVALVGESGSGKSTILRLLFRFYDPTAGSIKLDGVDIRELTQTSYRSQIGSVPQDAALFNDTIRYNIAYGAIGAKPEGPTMEDVIEAAKSAQIHNRIMSFPDGYETRVGERGVRLSGGEKQRVAIARVMIRNPPVILLDEATSALDTTTEREIQEALHKLGEGRTTIAIAHRLSTIVNSDLILVVDKGKIVERGNHGDLLALKGVYSDLWAKQIRAEVEAGGSIENQPLSQSKHDLEDVIDSIGTTHAPNSAAPSR
ncbi:hypothetical protein O181_019659 [Austropuccinia psidii MF-1]|uniref:ABC transporter n=1 Tax=Austropuccinia psidii MF-1 TaxID=1389203 RepID=A0A9Q3C9Z0_9BASI|nr:hypothetical protein [Austropuccinia psidii MF-1]